MRALIVCVLLAVPLIASSQSGLKVIQRTSVSVSTLSEDLERLPARDVATFIRSLPAGVTNTNGTIRIRGVQTPASSRLPGIAYSEMDPALPLRERLRMAAQPAIDAFGRDGAVPLTHSLRDLQHAAYAPSLNGDGGVVLFYDSPADLEPLIGEEPHVTLEEGIEWTCANINLIYDDDAGTLTAEPAGCGEPTLIELACPTTLRAGETGTFTATTLGDFDFPVRWTLKNEDGLSLAAEYASTNPERWELGERWSYDISARYETVGSPSETIRADYEFKDWTDAITVTATLGDVAEESCEVDIERDAGASGPPDWANKGGRFGIGYDAEFRSLFATAGLGVQIPIDMPLYGDVSVRAFSSGVRDYIGVNVEALCRTDLADLGALFWGGGLHALRQSSPGNSDLELGFGLSARFEYDAGLPVEPSIGLSVSRQYGTFIPQAAIGGTFWW